MSAPGLPEGWIVQHDAASNRQYYYDTTTGQSHWTLPDAIPNSEHPHFQSVPLDTVPTSDQGTTDRGFASDFAMKMAKEKLGGKQKPQEQNPLANLPSTGDLLSSMFGGGKPASGSAPPAQSNDMYGTITGAITNAFTDPTQNSGNQSHGNQSGKPAKNNDVMGMVTGALSSALGGKSSSQQSQGNQGYGNQGSGGKPGKSNDVVGMVTGALSSALGGKSNQQTGNQGYGNQSSGSGKPGKSNDVVGMVTGAVSGLLGGKASQQKGNSDGQGQVAQGHGNQANDNQSGYNHSGGNHGGGSNYSANQSGNWHPGNVGNSPQIHANPPPPGGVLPGSFPTSQTPPIPNSHTNPPTTQGNYGQQPYGQQPHGYNQPPSQLPQQPSYNQSHSPAPPAPNSYGQGYGQGQYGQGQNGQGQYGQAPPQNSHSPPPQGQYPPGGNYPPAGAPPYPQSQYQQGYSQPPPPPANFYGQPYGQTSPPPSSPYGQGQNNYPYSQPQGPGRREIEE